MDYLGAQHPGGSMIRMSHPNPSNTSRMLSRQLFFLASHICTGKYTKEQFNKRHKKTYSQANIPFTPSFPLGHIEMHCLSSFTGLIQKIYTYGVKWLRAKAQSRLYLNIKFLLSSKGEGTKTPNAMEWQ